VRPAPRKAPGKACGKAKRQWKPRVGALPCRGHPGRAAPAARPAASGLSASLIQPCRGEAPDDSALAVGLRQSAVTTSAVQAGVPHFGAAIRRQRPLGRRQRRTAEGGQVPSAMPNRCSSGPASASALTSQAFIVARSNARLLPALRTHHTRQRVKSRLSRSSCTTTVFWASSGTSLHRHRMLKRWGGK